MVSRLPAGEASGSATSIITGSGNWELPTSGAIRSLSGHSGVLGNVMRFAAMYLVFAVP
jgi:hypothetical protein